MSARIPDEKISEIKNAVNIVDLISEVVRLKRAGKNFIGLCPFHSEKTPSFTVTPDKQIFYCFGCHQGGDVFAFLMKHENLSYVEAVRLLAARAGVLLPDPKTGGTGSFQKTDKERILEINAFAATYFREMLKQEETGKEAQRYLRDRGISKNSIDRFKIGYAPGEWAALSGFMAKKKILGTDLEKAGLAIARKSGVGVYDRFRSRVIFPIMNMRMQTIGFGGRAIDEQMPKYLNSPETPVYVKSRSLFGLHLAKDRCRMENEAYIVEGYFDCIMLHQHGVENTVATLGTSLTVEHIRILKGYAEKMILVFDSDDAGIKAASRSLGLFAEQQIKARILVLPKDHDPDSFMRAQGPSSFREMAEKAADPVGFLIDTAVKKHGMAPEGKLLILHEMIEPIGAVSDPVARSLYVRELSERLFIDEEAILSKISMSLKKSGGVKTDAGENVPDSERQSSPMLEPPLDLSAKGGRFERRIIQMMLHFPDILQEVRDSGVLEKFENRKLKKIGKIILEKKDKDNDPVSEVLGCSEDEDSRQIVLELAVCQDDWKLAGCMKLIHQFLHSSVRREKGVLHQIKAAEKQNDQELLVKLLQERQKRALQVKKEKLQWVHGCLKE